MVAASFYAVKDNIMVNWNDRIMVIDGSSDGHTGRVILVKQHGWVRVLRDDGKEVDLPESNYVVLAEDSKYQTQE